MLYNNNVNKTKGEKRMTRKEMERRRKLKKQQAKNNMRQAFLQKYFKFLAYTGLALAFIITIAWMFAGASEQQVKEVEAWKNGTYVYPQG